MATRSVALTFPDTHMGPGRSLFGSYTGLLNGDDGAPCAMLGYDEVSIVVTGTFGAGGSVALEGSHDGVTYFALRNHGGRRRRGRGLGVPFRAASRHGRRRHDLAQRDAVPPLRLAWLRGA
jgi:hypothetical protein